MAELSQQTSENVKTQDYLMGRQGSFWAVSLVAALFLAANEFYDVRHFPYDASTYWKMAVSPEALQSHEVIRGYLFPFILGLWIRVFTWIGINPLQGFRFFSSLIYALVLAVQLPLMFSYLFGGVTSFFRRLIPGLLTLLVFPGLLIYPLSDLPALGFIWCAVYLARRSNESASDRRWQLLWLCLCGFMAGAAYNTRSIYLFAVVAILIYICFAHRNRLVLVAAFCTGVLIVSAPQVFVNKQLHGKYSANPSIAIGEESLFTKQLIWGITTQKYETDISSTAFAGVRYADPAGDALLAKISNTSPPDSVLGYISAVFRFPVDFLGLYGRHVMNGLDVRDGLTYTRSPPTHRRSISLLNVFVLMASFVVLRLALLNARQDVSGMTLRNGLDKYIYATILLIPVVVIVPSAIETRFFLPLHMLGYLVLSMKFDLDEFRTRIGKEGLYYFVCMASFLAVYLAITEATMANVKASWAG
jgi:hypothetical protein